MLTELSKKQNSKIFASDLQQAQKGSLTQVLILFPSLEFTPLFFFKYFWSAHVVDSTAMIVFTLVSTDRCDIYVWHSRKKRTQKVKIWASYFSV